MSVEIYINPFFPNEHHFPYLDGPLHLRIPGNEDEVRQHNKRDFR